MTAALRWAATSAAAMAGLWAAGTGCFFLWWSGVVLRKLFVEYQDNSPATYIVIGLMLLVIAVIAFVAAIMLAAVALRLALHGRRLR